MDDRSRSTVRRAAPYHRQLAWLLLPYALGAGVLIAAPAVVSAGLAFTAYDAISPPVWTGLRNFRLALADLRFGMALWNSLFFAVWAVPLRTLGALGLALLLFRPFPAAGAYRAAVYLPTVVPDAAYAFVWLWILNPLYGPLNILLSALGLPAPAWLVSPDLAKPALVCMSLFQIGEGFVVLLAGLQNVPDEYFAAAAVDGAGRWQLFRYVLLPLLLPWLALLVFRDAILTLQTTFAPAYLMTGGEPYYATLFLPLLAYKEAFDGFRFGQGSAIMLLMVLVTAGLIGGVYAVFRRGGFADEA